MPRQDADDAWAAHLALKPAEEASSSRSKSAAAVPDIDAPSRTVRPPFRLFDPFSVRLLRFQPDGSSKAPVRTSVATEFNPGEQRYHTIKLRLQSIGNSAVRGKRVERADGRGKAHPQHLCDLCVLCGETTFKQRLALCATPRSSVVYPQPLVLHLSNDQFHEKQDE